MVQEIKLIDHYVKIIMLRLLCYISSKIPDATLFLQ